MQNDIRLAESQRSCVQRTLQPRETHDSFLSPSKECVAPHYRCVVFLSTLSPLSLVNPIVACYSTSTLLSETATRQGSSIFLVIHLSIESLVGIIDPLSIKIHPWYSWEAQLSIIMSALFRTCPDGHRCQHDSLCVEAEEGSYYCDCSTSTGDYAGLSCEFAAENYCLGTDGFALVWCTNRGLCQVSSSNLWYCECPPEYDGPVSSKRRMIRKSSFFIPHKATMEKKYLTCRLPFHLILFLETLLNLALRICCWSKTKWLAKLWARSQSSIGKPKGWFGSGSFRHHCTG